MPPRTPSSRPWTPGVPHWDELDDRPAGRGRAADGGLRRASPSTPTRRSAASSRRLRAAGELDNTIVLYILGDNGASAEGGIEGTLNETLRLNGLGDDADRIARAARHGSAGRRRCAALPGGLGAGHGHAVPVDQAGRLPLRRHPQRPGRALAGRHRRARRGAPPVAPRHRRAADAARGRRPAAARRPSTASRSSRSTACRSPTPSTTQERRTAHARSTSRCSATAASTTRAGRRVTKHTHAVGDRAARHAGARATTGGSSTTPAPTGRQAQRPRGRAPGAAGRAAGALPRARRARNQVLPLDDRLVRAVRRPRPQGRPATVAATTLRLGPDAPAGCREDAVPSLKNTSLRGSARGDPRGSGDDGGDRRAGRPLRRLVAVRRRRPARPSPTTTWAW